MLHQTSVIQNGIFGKKDSPRKMPHLPNRLIHWSNRFYEQINQHRESKGLSPLVLDGWLSQQAREHSDAMAKGKASFDEQGIQQRHEEILYTGPYKKVCSLIAMNEGHPFPDRNRSP